jgi:hypothetical protein
MHLGGLSGWTNASDGPLGAEQRQVSSLADIRGFHLHSSFEGKQALEVPANRCGTDHW